MEESPTVEEWYSDDKNELRRYQHLVDIRQTHLSDFTRSDSRYTQ